MADKKIDPKCVEPCPCGATWYDAEENPKGKVTIIKRKRIRGCGSSAPAVVCTACGRSAYNRRETAGCCEPVECARFPVWAFERR